eukprot:COSAG02_NODE_15730_length_1145_cov_2.179732_2_plen_57_part_00
MVWVVLIEGRVHGVYSCAVDAHLQAEARNGLVVQCQLNSEVPATKCTVLKKDAVDS